MLFFFVILLQKHNSLKLNSDLNLKLFFFTVDPIIHHTTLNYNVSKNQYRQQDLHSRL